MTLGVPSIEQLLRDAASAPVLLLPRIEPHPAGLWLAAASLALGLAAAAGDGHQALAWLALAGLVAAMLLHAGLKRARSGWRVDFAARSLAPQGLPGEPVTIAGAGWSIVCAPGERRHSVAIDLRHAERGRVARLFDSAVRVRGASLRRLDELADVLAQRLRIERGGPRW